MPPDSPTQDTWESPRFNHAGMCSNSIAGLTIDVVEPNLLSFGCGGVQGYRAGHQRQTEITFPIRSGGHRTLHSTRPSDSTTYVPCRSDPQSPRSSAIIPTYYPHDLSF